MKNFTRHIIFPIALAMFCLTLEQANAQSSSRSFGSGTFVQQAPTRSFASPSFSAPRTIGSTARIKRPSSTYTPPVDSFRPVRSQVVPTRSRTVYKTSNPVFRTKSGYVSQSFSRQPRTCTSGTCRGCLLYTSPSPRD